MASFPEVVVNRSTQVEDQKSSDRKSVPANCINLRGVMRKHGMDDESCASFQHRIVQWEDSLYSEMRIVPFRSEWQEKNRARIGRIDEEQDIQQWNARG